MPVSRWFGLASTATLRRFSLVLSLVILALITLTAQGNQAPSDPYSGLSTEQQAAWHEAALAIAKANTASSSLASSASSADNPRG